jgi:hypothetical protein
MDGMRSAVQAGVSWARQAVRALAEACGVLRRPPTDPFATLEVQYALGRLEAEITRLLRDDVSFARAHHLMAAQLAYGQALEEACRLAGVPGRDLELDLDDAADPGGPTAAPGDPPTPRPGPTAVRTDEEQPLRQASRSGVRWILAEAELRSRGWDW